MVRSSSPPRVKAAVLERPRRSTAGQRLSSLVGKAQEEDETFWSHSIWNEKGGGFADGKRSKKRRRRRRNDDDDDDKESELSSSSGGGGSDGEGSTSDNDEESSSDDDGEGSYRMSEDDPSMAEDQFDSDFDESESDDDDNNDNEMVGEEEFELLAEEKRNAASMKRKKNQRLLSSSLSSSAAPPPITGRQMIKKKKGSSKTGKNGASSSKRGPMGTGWNEGLILNWNAQYPLPSSRPLPIVSAGVAEVSLPPTSTSSSTTMPAPILSSSSNNLSQLSALQSMTVPPDATTISQPISDQPPLSSKHLKNGSILQPNLPSQNLRTSSSSAATTATAITASPSTATSVQPPSPTNKQKQVQLTKKQQLQQSISERKKSQRQQFTQEELILEAVQCTETTNAKWLHARQRNKEEAAVIEKSAAGSKYKHSNTNKKLVSRYYSRRGCHNTLTFMDMDHLPEFLVRGESQYRHPRSPSVCDYAVARKITSPSSRPLACARNSLGANELTQEQLPRQHQSATSTHSLERTFEKCIITGKIAKYRDPKSRLGYHDIEAYKELKRKLESGEIVIPKENHVQNVNEAKGRLLSNKIAKGEGERTRASGTTSRKRGDANAIASMVVATTNYFPFADNLPTMIAKITPPTLSLLGTDSVKVMVTQRGVPVSPPLSPSQPPFHSVELPKMSEDDEKQPPEMMQSTKHNGNVECTTIPANIVPVTTSTNEVHATTESAQLMIIPANSYASIVTNDGENGNRHRHDGVIPESNGSGSASVTLPTEGVVAKNNGGGAMERELMALNSNVPLAPNISNTKSGSDGAADKVIVPDATASTNDKRTTIEAN